MGNKNYLLVAAAIVVLAGCGSDRPDVTASSPANESPEVEAPVVEAAPEAAPPAEAESARAEATPAQVVDAPATQPQTNASLDAAPDLFTDPRRDPWFGDFEGMVERRVIRALVTYSRTHYFLDGAEPRGLSYEALKRFETVINEQLDTGHLEVHVVAIIFDALIDRLPGASRRHLYGAHRRHR